MGAALAQQPAGSLCRRDPAATAGEQLESGTWAVRREASGNWCRPLSLSLSLSIFTHAHAHTRARTHLVQERHMKLCEGTKGQST